MERLQRVLAARGVASRRKAEELIAQGRVRVDGQTVREQGVKVDPTRQKIEVDGKLLPIFRHRYILLNKPAGYITTTADERDRRTVMELVQVSEPVVPVGRLDRPTEGLLLLTNDGDVAYRVTHPRFEIDKEYEALLDGHPPAAVLERVRRGIVIDGEKAMPTVVRPIRNAEDGTIVRVVIQEGRNRIVRKMFEEVGYPILRLVRTRVGPLQLGGIPRGQWRDLTDGEVEQLREALHLRDEDAGYEPPSAPPRSGGKRPNQYPPRQQPPRPPRQEWRDGRPPAQQPAARRPTPQPAQRDARPAAAGKPGMQQRRDNYPRSNERGDRPDERRAGQAPDYRRPATTGTPQRRDNRPPASGPGNSNQPRQDQYQRPTERQGPSDEQRDRRVRRQQAERAAKAAAAERDARQRPSSPAGKPASRPAATTSAVPMAPRTESPKPDGRANVRTPYKVRGTPRTVTRQRNTAGDQEAAPPRPEDVRVDE